jgi:hypothetical protein
VTRDCLSGQVAQRGKFGHGGNVVVGSVIGNRLHPAKQRQNPISLEQGRLGAMAREDYRSAAECVAVSLQKAHKIQQWLMYGSHGLLCW